MIVLDACHMTDKKTSVFVVTKPVEYQNKLITSLGKPLNQDCTLLELVCSWCSDLTQ